MSTLPFSTVMEGATINPGLEMLYEDTDEAGSKAISAAQPSKPLSVQC